MRRRARDAPAAKAADNVEQSSQGKALAPVPRGREKGSSSNGVMPQCVFDLNMIL